MILDPTGYEPEPDPITIRDFRPAVVTLPDGVVLGDALAVVTTARVYAFIRPPGGGVRTAFVADHDTPPEDVQRPRFSPAVPTVIRLAHGAGEVEIVKSAACTCSSRAPSSPPWTPDRRGS